MAPYIFYLATALDPLNGPVDLHLPDKEELWIQFIEAQEEREREEGFRFEIENEDGTTEEILVS